MVLPITSPRRTWYVPWMKSLRIERAAGCPNGGKKRGAAAWCPHCYTNARGRTNMRGHVGYRTKPSPYIPWESYIMKRPETKAAGGKLGSVSAVDEAWIKKYPSIVEYLTAEEYEDGSVREPSALSVSIREGDFLLALNDKELKQSLYTQAHTLTDGLRLMEGALAEGKGQWRPWKAGKRK